MCRCDLRSASLPNRRTGSSCVDAEVVADHVSHGLPQGLRGRWPIRPADCLPAAAAAGRAAQSTTWAYSPIGAKASNAATSNGRMAVTDVKKGYGSDESAVPQDGDNSGA